MQSLLKELYLQPDLGTPQGPPGGAGKCQRKMSESICLDCCFNKLTIDKRGKKGWMKKWDNLIMCQLATCEPMPRVSALNYKVEIRLKSKGFFITHI